MPSSMASVALSFVVSFLLLLANTALASYPSISEYGTSGGDGPTGGIGDKAHPVLKPLAFITDSLIPTTPNSTRQLAPGPPPVLLRNNQTTGIVNCSAVRREVVVDSSKNGARQEMLVGRNGHCRRPPLTVIPRL